MRISAILNALSWTGAIRNEQAVIAPSTTFIGRLLNAATYRSTAIALDKQQTINKSPQKPLNKKERLDVLWTRVSQNQHHPDKCALYLEEILAIDPRNDAALNRLGIVFAEKKELDKALGYFNKALSVDADAIIYHNIGVAYYEMKDYRKAALSFKKALSLEESSADRYLAYAKIQELLGNDTAMFNALKKAVELERNKTTLFLLLKAYDDRNMRAEANAVEKELLKIILPFHNVRRLMRRSSRVGYIDLTFEQYHS